MPTVILGGGIIGASIAYYLSAQNPKEEIHIVESSSQLFSAASGYAAGFLAKDWFAPSLAPLAALSFDLHDELAVQNGGERKWGYMKGAAFSLDVASSSKKRGARGDDWLRHGTSRAETAAGSVDGAGYEPPAWLTKQKGRSVEKISSGDDTVAQVDPLRLSQYLMDTSISRGVKLHHPAKAVSLVTDQEASTITGVKILNFSTKTESTLPCTKLIVAAGPWTPGVFKELFPSSKASLPISPLAGYSLVFRSPRYTLAHERETYQGRSHAVFTTHPSSCGFSPEIFSREGGEIYIAGLNSTEIPLPPRAEDTHKLIDPAEQAKLRDVTVRLMGKLADGHEESTDEAANVDDLETLREGLCFRPVSSRGVPIVSKVTDELLGGGIKGDVFVASGHGPWGISLALGTGKVITEMIEGLQPSADVSGLGI